MATRKEELTELDKQQEKTWEELRNELLAGLGTVLQNDDGRARLLAISDEEWAEAEAADAEGVNVGA